MKRFISIATVVLLVGALTVPALAHGPAWGRGGPMKYGWRGGPQNCPYYGGGYDQLTTEQRESLDKANKKFYDETAELRKELWTKRAELNTILDSADPDVAKAKVLLREIGDLRTKLSEKRLDHELEVRKIAPDARFGKGPGRGGPAYGKGFGRHRRGGGYGMGYGFNRGGFGPGSCWN